MLTHSFTRILLASMPPEVDNKRLQLRRSTKYADGRRLFADGLTTGWQLRQLVAAAFTVTGVAVNLTTNALPRLIQTAENHLLLDQQSRRQVVNESLVLLLDARAWTPIHLLCHTARRFSNSHISLTSLWSLWCQTETVKTSASVKNILNRALSKQASWFY